MVLELFFNLAALIAFCVISTFFMDKWPIGRSISLWIQGVVFGLIAMLGMMYPVEMAPGFFFDGRAVVLSLAAWHFGWRASILSCLIAMGYRIYLGGGGVLPGTVSMGLSSAIGLGFRLWLNPEKEDPLLQHALLLGFAVTFSIIVSGTFLLGGPNLKVFANSFVVPIVINFPLATLMAGRVLADYQSNQRAQSKVALNEAMVRTIFDDSPLMVLLIDPRTKNILDANDTALGYYKYKKQTLVSLKLADIEVKKSVGMREVINMMGSNPQTFDHVQHRLSTGEVREVDVSYSTIHFEGREVEILFVVDITDQMLFIESTQEALAEKEDILLAAMDGFWVIDEQYRIHEVNSAYCSISGYLPEELIDQDLRKFDCLEKNHHLYFQSRKEDEASRFETQHRTKDGQIIDLEVSVRRKNSLQEQVTYVFFRDVTKERESKQQLRMLSACLSVAENSVVITNHQQQIEWVNEAFSRMSGYRRDEVIGKTSGEIFQSGVNSVAAYKDLRDARQAGNPWKGELTNLKKDHSTYTVDATLTPLKNNEGEVTHYIGIHQDISEKKELEALYLRSQRLETVGRLTSGIAHDLNNILSPILMSAELLQSTLKEREEASLAEIIVTSADRGSTLLHQLLGFARGTAAEKQLLPPGPVIKECVKLYKETFPKNIQLQMHLDQDLPTISMDPGQITQIVGNLIINAKDALPEGGTLTIEAGMESVSDHQAKSKPHIQAGSFLRIRVSDTGAGIAKELREKIFEPFFTTKPLGKGTGLGLPTCLNIVKGHNGFLDIQSEVGKGTVVDIYLPANKDRKEAPQTSREPHSIPASGKGKRILVVDDEEAVRTLVRAALEALSYDVVVRKNGEEALDLLNQNPQLDLILLDFEMPKVNGSQVVSEMDRLHLKIPVVFITGMVGEEKERASHFLGRPVLFKPFSLGELRITVEEHLETGSP